MLPAIPGTSPAALDEATCQRLREAHYNATLIERINIHDDLFRIRVRPDAGFSPFEPGQYVAIGLGNWEPRVQPTQAEALDEKKWQKVVRRAYSISCPLIADDGTLLPCERLDYLEFYITLVRQANDGHKPPALTPRLFTLQPGDRLVVESKITGHYTLAGIHEDETVLMIGTGTGEAPHNAMTAHLLQHGHRGRIINTTTVRHQADLGYLEEHRHLMKRFPQYRYLPMTTRDPQNLDRSHPDYVGKQYIQSLFTSGRLAEMADDPLAPENTHVFLCGNPAMIGIVRPGETPPSQPGMLPLLTAAGFTNEHHGPGHVCYEKYW
ncbi:MAG: ferredoxin--NADP reductase [Planctomycetaceae bacterium]